MKFALKLLAGAALAVSFGTAAQAADMLQPADPIYNSPLFNFEGFYVGGTAGVTGSNTVYGNLGVVVGNNFQVTDGIIIGPEFQGDVYWTGNGWTAYDALAFGRIGGFITDNILLTGDAGLGFLNGAPVYAFGGAAETSLTGNLSLRGDVQAISFFGHAPSAVRATAGLMFHLN